MKVLNKHKIFKKLIIIFLSILVLSFCHPKQVEASIGGKLLDPVLSMFVGLSDGAISLLQRLVLDMDSSIISIITSTNTIAKILGIVLAVVVAVAGIVAIVASGGTAVAIVAGVIKVTINAVVVGVVTFSVSSVLANAALPEDFVLPQIKLSPYEIFANQVPLFDVDFFNPMEDVAVDVDDTNVKELKTNIDSSEMQSVLDELRNRYYYISNY